MSSCLKRTCLHVKSSEFIPFLDGFHRTAYDAVLLVHDAIILVHVPDVSGNEGLQLLTEHGHGLLQLGVILRLDVRLCSLSHDAVRNVGRNLEVGVEVVEGSVFLAKLLAMLIGVTQSGVDDQ